MKISISLQIVVVAILLLVITVAAEVPLKITYQGKLTDELGQPPPDKTIDITFSIYRSDEIQVWTSGPQPVQVKDGLFSYILGSNVTLPSYVFPAKFTRFIGIKVGDDAEIVPRTELVSVPYAYNALFSDTTEYAMSVADGAISDAAVNSEANIAVTKIEGTAVNLSTTQSITGNKTFDGDVYFGDSTMIVNSNGIRIGDPTIPSSSYSPITIERNYNTGSPITVIDCNIVNNGPGSAMGLWINLSAATDNGDCAGIWSDVRRNPAGSNNSNIWGGHFVTLFGENAYGLYSLADQATHNYAIYGTRTISNSNYAGYFYGNTYTTGTSTKADGGYIIDHPADPENMFLTHSDVSSPDKKNVYDGTVVTDDNGDAEVELPGYFESLNTDFRYQLTVIGEFAQAIISEKINGNRFSIKTSKPHLEVCWQVTGIRKDAFAKASTKQVEIAKNSEERGLYQNPELYGYGIEKAIDGKHHKGKAEEQNLE